MGISFAFAVLAFPKKVKEAYEVASQTIEQLQRPLYAISYGSLRSLDSKALELTRRLHRGSGICVIRQEMVDLSRDGWRADLLVEYALSPSGRSQMRGEGCRARCSALSRSFHPRELFHSAMPEPPVVIYQAKGSLKTDFYLGIGGKPISIRSTCGTSTMDGSSIQKR
jgi:hypothetical protein